MTREVSSPGRSQEFLPPGTALQKAQELWDGLDIETQTLESGEEEKLVELSSTSRIRIASGKDIGHNPFVKIHIVDDKEKIGFRCIISSNGKSSFKLGFGRTRITVGDFAAMSDYHDISTTPGAKDEEQVMSAFVDWAQKSIDKGTVTKLPYKLENVRLLPN